MATVTVTIDGKAYRMACDEGQEEHLARLADRFDRYVTHLKSSFGEIGDLRLTVMAGIMVMDEMAEMEKRLKGFEDEAESLRRSHDEVLSQSDEKDVVATRILADVAARIEQIASRIAPRGNS